MDCTAAKWRLQGEETNRLPLAHDDCGY